MKVKLLTALSSDKGSFAPGDVIEMDSDEAKRYIDAGLAESVKAEKPAKKKK